MIVVDTNIIAHLFIHGPQTESVSTLSDFEEDWVAPPLWRSELYSVLTCHLRYGSLTFEDSLDVLSSTEEFMEGKEIAVDSIRVLDLVNNSHCTSYDCEFVALAQQMDCSLVTFDKKIVRSFPESAVFPEQFLN